MSKRIKHTAPAIRSRSEAEDVLGQIRQLTIERNQRMLERDHVIQGIQEQHAGPLEAIETELTQKTELLSGWADANPSEFAGKKSLQMTHGQVGWRVGNPTLKTLSGWTWDRVLEKLKSAATYAGFIRTKQEVDKAAILAMRESLLDGDLREMGVRVVQEDAFFVEPDLENPENRRAA
ncbi:MAG: host-nuclease inhibitor Gam family protein [Verrucomicrobia bacterium]|nr:host-nuclease inhibitor Gam family protein [Verrucomicrobiota bacterium]